MTEVLLHLFVLVVSPTLIGGITIFLWVRGRPTLAFLGSALSWIACALIANRLFDGHLLAYSLLYSLYACAPFIAAFVMAAAWMTKVWKWLAGVRAAKMSL